MTAAPLLSVTTRKDGAVVWCAWYLYIETPIEPDAWDIALTWEGAVSAALHWLKERGYTRSRADHGEGASWWSHRAEDEIEARLSMLPRPEYLAALDLQWPCTRSQLTRAWRNKAQSVHPDRGGSDTAFVQVRAAYENVAQFVESSTI